METATAVCWGGIPTTPSWENRICGSWGGAWTSVAPAGTTGRACAELRAMGYAPGWTARRAAWSWVTGTPTPAMTSDSVVLSAGQLGRRRRPSMTEGIGSLHWEETHSNFTPTHLTRDPQVRLRLYGGHFIPCGDASHRAIKHGLRCAIPSGPLHRAVIRKDWHPAYISSAELRDIARRGFNLPWIHQE